MCEKFSNFSDFSEDARACSEGCHVRVFFGQLAKPAPRSIRPGTLRVVWHARVAQRRGSALRD